MDKKTWRTISKANEPILDWLDSMDGDKFDLIDLGCGQGVLSDKAMDRGFTVTPVDYSDVPYRYAIRRDVKEMIGTYDYIIASGYPPSCIGEGIKGTYYMYTTQREDFKDLYPGKEYFYRGVYIKTNIEPLDKWLVDNKEMI